MLPAWAAVTIFALAGGLVGGAVSATASGIVRNPASSPQASPFTIGSTAGLRGVAALPGTQPVGEELPAPTLVARRVEPPGPRAEVDAGRIERVRAHPIAEDGLVSEPEIVMLLVQPGQPVSQQWPG